MPGEFTNPDYIPVPGSLDPDNLVAAIGQRSSQVTEALELGYNPTQSIYQKTIFSGPPGNEIMRVIASAFTPDPVATVLADAIESKLGVSLPTSAIEAIHTFVGGERAAGRWDAVKLLSLPVWGHAEANLLDWKSLGQLATAGVVTHGRGYLQGDGVTAHLGGIPALGTLGLTQTIGHVAALVYAEDTRGGDHFLFGVSDDGNNNGGTMLMVGDTAITGWCGWQHLVGSTGVGVASTDSRGVLMLNSNAVGVEVLSTKNTTVTSASVGANTFPISTTVGPIFMGFHKNYGNVYQRTDAKLGALGIGLGMSASDIRAYSANLETLWKNLTGLTY